MRLRRNHEWAEGGDGGRGRVYEAYEVKNKRQKLRCASPEKEKYFYLFMK
jgi:hypothetical protein